MEGEPGLARPALPLATSVRPEIGPLQSDVDRQRNETSQQDPESERPGPSTGASDDGSAISGPGPSLESPNRVPVDPRRRASWKSAGAKVPGGIANPPDEPQSKVEARSGVQTDSGSPGASDVRLRGADRLEPVSGALSWTIPPQTAARVVGEERRVRNTAPMPGSVRERSRRDIGRPPGFRACFRRHP